MHEPSIDDMRAMWEDIRELRPEWPDTFEETMRAPFRAAIIKTLCLHPGILAQWLATHMAINAERARLPSRHVDPPKRQRPLPFLDFKSRAAGEKPED